MKYGIKIIDGNLKAITEFPSDILLDNFEEITKEKYKDLINNISSFSKFDVATFNFIKDKEAEKKAQKQQETAILRQSLSNLVEELTLAERLGEDTTVLQKEFEDISKVYKASKNIPPKVYAGMRKVISLPDNKIKLEGTARDKDGEIVAVEWKKLKGTSAKIINPKLLDTEVKNLEVGNYTFRLTATDDKGDSNYSDVNVKVKPKEAIKIKVSTKEKNNIPASGELIKINVESNSEWLINTYGNAYVTPLTGIGNQEVTIQVLKNETASSVAGKIELIADDKKAYFKWNQAPNISVNVTIPPVACFDLESSILLANGTSKKLKDITLGEELLSLSLNEEIPFGSEAIPLNDVLGNLENRTAFVIDFGIQKVPEFRRIALVNGLTLNVTESHPLLASKNGKDIAWYMPDDLRSGMYIVDESEKLIEIDSKRTINETLEIGVLQVEGANNYIVENVVVHNAQLLRAEGRPLFVNGGVDLTAVDVINKNSFKV